VDLIVVGGVQKRAINQIVMPSRRFDGDVESVKNLVSVYESDFGVCRIVMSRWVPKGVILFLDSSRIEVLPAGGKEFSFPSAGDHRRSRERARCWRIHAGAGAMRMRTGASRV